MTQVASWRRHWPACATSVLHDHTAAVDQLFNQSVDLRPDAWWGTWLTEQLEPQRPWAKRRR